MTIYGAMVGITLESQKNEFVGDEVRSAVLPARWLV
jgi:hypothetical protein